MFTLILVGCGPVRLSEVFIPSSTRPAVSGVNHTVGEILDIRNAEVKKAFYATYLQIDWNTTNPLLISGPELWNKTLVVSPLDPTFDNCNGMCSVMNLRCDGTYSARRHDYTWGNYSGTFCSEDGECEHGQICQSGVCVKGWHDVVQPAWVKGAQSTCTTTASASFMLPMCICKR